MRKIAIGLLLLTLTACGGAATPTTGNDSTGGAPVTGASPSSMPLGSPPAGGDAPVSGAPGGDQLMEVGDLEKNVMNLLATTTGKPADTLKLQNKEDAEWPNGGLGCPKEGMMYTEMIVPGYKLTYTDGATTYEVHTDRSGNSAVWCDNGEPKTLGIS
ncbi:MAG: hypothetical protein JOZ51_21695 [Chloroflexi bacterium]|nr:hypothetical protein [Chloroflexota bacterium]